MLKRRHGYGIFGNYFYRQNIENFKNVVSFYSSFHGTTIVWVSLKRKSALPISLVDSVSYTQSYYMCLANKLSQNTSCSNRTCSSITLPTDTTFIDVEECEATEDLICKIDILEDLFFADDICKGTKPCVVKEYLPKDYIMAVPKRDEIFHCYVYMNPPRSSHGTRVIRPYKIIYKEQYIISGLQLIGTLGGTLGLMIGFSFMGSIVSISEFATGLIQFIQRNKKMPQ